MLRPAQTYYPMRLDTTEEVPVVLESILGTSQVLFPRVRIVNKSPVASIQFVLEETEDLGYSSDPLISGKTTVLRLQRTLAPGEVVWHDFTVAFLSQDADAFPALSHTLKVTNLASTPSVQDIISFTIYGLYEDPTRSSPKSVFSVT